VQKVHKISAKSEMEIDFENDFHFGALILLLDTFSHLSGMSTYCTFCTSLHLIVQKNKHQTLKNTKKNQKKQIAIICVLKCT
jgi:hypothetical protein